MQVAIDLWTKAIRRNPKSYAAHVNRGSAYLLSGYVLRGIRDWYDAETLCPLFAYAVYDGEFIPEASHDRELLGYVAALELDPDHVASVVMMAATYLDFGLPGRAAELYRKSIQLTKNPLLKSQLDHWLGRTEE